MNNVFNSNNYIQVQAVTDNGAGEFSAAVNYVKVDDRGKGYRALISFMT